MKILVTGFKRYAKHIDNPSELLLPEIKDKDVVTCLLDVSYDNAKTEFLAAIKKEKPDFILSLGLSPYRQYPTLEEYAYNEMNSIQPDEDGHLLNEPTLIVKDGAKSLKTALDLSSLQQSLAIQSIPVSVSIDPGRFVCNLVYYTGLSSGIPALFIHLPLESDYSLEDSLEAVKATIEYIKLIIK